MDEWRTHQEITWAEGNDPVPRTVVCAANRYADKPEVILCGARHWDSVMRNMAEALGGIDVVLSWGKEEQGFIDQFGVFMSREEAAYVVKANGQVIREPEELDRGYLFSENIY